MAEAANSGQPHAGSEVSCIASSHDSQPSEAFVSMRKVWAGTAGPDAKELISIKTGPTPSSCPSRPHYAAELLMWLDAPEVMMPSLFPPRC